MKKFNLILFTMFTMLCTSMVGQDFQFDCPNCPQVVAVNNISSTYQQVAYEGLSGQYFGAFSQNLDVGSYHCYHLFQVMSEEMYKATDARIDAYNVAIEAGSTAICAYISADLDGFVEDNLKEVKDAVIQVLSNHEFYSQFSNHISENINSVDPFFRSYFNPVNGEKAIDNINCD